MTYTLKKTVVLVGMMGAGKTAVGTALARGLGVPFRDSDAAIEQAADRTIAEIFARDGEPFFREKESQVIARLLAGPPGVLSTGGGAFMSEWNRQTISDQGVSVWLKVALPLLWSRVKHRETRPLLQTADPLQTLTDLCANREPFYAKADLAVEADAKLSVDDMAAKVRDALLTRPDVLEDR